jgi:hypothetical protein
MRKPSNLCSSRSFPIKSTLLKWNRISTVSLQRKDSFPLPSAILPSLPTKSQHHHEQHHQQGSFRTYTPWALGAVVIGALNDDTIEKESTISIPLRESLTYKLYVSK